MVPAIGVYIHAGSLYYIKISTLLISSDKRIIMFIKVLLLHRYVMIKRLVIVHIVFYVRVYDILFDCLYVAVLLRSLC